MKICISSSGSNKDSLVDARFGRCQYFAIYDGKNFNFIKNETLQTTRGAGIAAAQKVTDLDCEILITGNIGPNAFNVLQATGVKVFTSVFGKTVMKALRDYQEGKLIQTKVSTGGFGRGKRWQ